MDNFFDVFRDPIWSAIATLVSISIPLTAIAIRRFIFPRKSLSVSITFEQTAFNVTPSFSKYIKTELFGDQIKNARLITFKITNNGVEPIVGTDYSSPISFYFGKDARIFWISFSNKNPSSLSAETENDINRINLSIPLLNSGDNLEMIACVGDANKNIQLSGHISGVTLRSLRNNYHRKQRFLAYFNLAALVANASISAFYFAKFYYLGSNPFIALINAAIAVLSWHVVTRYHMNLQVNNQISLK